MNEIAQQDDLDEDFGLFDVDNPRSLINLVPDEIRKAMLELPKDLVYADEAEIREKAQPTEALNHLRLNFWTEYNNVQARRLPKMRWRALIQCVSRDYVIRVVCMKQPYLAWLITPPADYATMQADILYGGLERMREVMRMELYVVTRETKTDKEGNQTVTETRKPNIPAMAELRKTVEFLANRVQGTLVHKIALKSQSEVRASLTDTTPRAQTYAPDALEEMTKMLGAVNERLAAATGAPIDVPALPAKATR